MCGVCGNMSTGVQRTKLVAVLVAQDREVGCERRRVARDVDDARRPESAGAAQCLPGEPGSRWIDDDQVGRPRVLAELLERLPHVAREEARVRDPVHLRVLDRAGDRLLRDLDAPDGARGARKGQPDRARPAVEVVDDLGARQPGRVACELVEGLRHLRVGLEEGVRPDAVPHAQQLLLDPGVAPEEPRREVRHLGRLVVDRPVDRAHLGEAGERLDEEVRVEVLAGCRHEDDQRLPRVPPLAHDEVAQVPGLRVLVVRLEALRAGPLLDRLADRVADGRREEALLHVDDLVPAARPVEAEHEAVRAGREGVLELVPVAELGARGHDRLERRLGEAAEARERVAHLLRLRLELARVGVVLEAAATARPEVAARRRDAVGPGLEQRRPDRLRKSALHLRRTGAHEVAGQPTAHEDDEPVDPPDAVSAVREGVDPDLELLALAHRRRHPTSVPGSVAALAERARARQRSARAPRSPVATAAR